MHVVQMLLLIVAHTAATLECPTWHIYDAASGMCVCKDQFSHSTDGIVCKYPERVYLRLDYCMTVDSKRNLTVAGPCHRGSYSSHNRTFMGAFRLLPKDPKQLEEVQCEPNNRQGLLCSKCAKGYGVPVTSLTPDCVKCTSHSFLFTLLLYFVIELLPTTIFFILIVIFRINIFSGPLIGYFLFCQVYTTISNHMFETYYFLRDSSSPGTRQILDISYVLSSIWALGAFNILPPICLSSKISFLDALTLKYVRVLHPLFLVPLTFFLIDLHARNVRPIVYLWRPFGGCLRRLNQNIDTNDSIIHAYATLFFLSFGILNYITFKLLDSMVLLHENAYPEKSRLMTDPTIQRYSREHAPYVAAAYGMLIPLGFLPAVLASLYPIGWFRNALERYLSHRRRIMLGIFFDTLHGNFKDGLDGTRDYRSLLGIVMLLAVAIVLTNAHQTGHYTLGATLIVAFVLILVSLFFAYARPCKTYLANLSVSFHTATSSIMCILLVSWLQECEIIGTEAITGMFASLVLSPHLLVLLGVVYKLFQTKRVGALLTRARSLCRGLRQCRPVPTTFTQHYYNACEHACPMN